MVAVIVRPMPPNDAALVFPLIREIAPSLTLAAWLRQSKRLTSARIRSHFGVMTAIRLGRPFPIGLLCYRRHTDVVRGQVLTAEYVVAMELLDQRPVVMAMVAALEARARELGCAGTFAIIPKFSEDVSRALQEGGHQPQGAILWKTLEKSLDRASGGAVSGAD